MITTIFDPPLPTDSLEVFNTKSFDTVSKYNAFGEELNDTAAAVNADAAAAALSASTASTAADDAIASELASANNALAAAGSMGAILWVSGTTYAVNDYRISPANNTVYRRRTAGAGTTDPSLDSTNWGAVCVNGLQMAFVSGTSATIGANTETCFTNPSAWVATVPALAVGEAFVVRGDNGRLDNTVDIGARSMVGPNGVIKSGVITLNVQPLLALRWWGDYYRSN